jgi:cytochrome bd-type quinol oxidase subunit 2
VDTQLVTRIPALRARRSRARRSARALAVSSLGPLIAFGGVVWAFAQPDRVTLLHPRGESFWWLAIEPPLLVVVAGLLFWLVVARPLIADLEEHDAAAR